MGKLEIWKVDHLSVLVISIIMVSELQMIKNDN